ncbi:MAG: hypothetical protein HY730_10245 [Candidatus Tectomicrobia bacterium]|uniref:Uncharacterized protein n=1 Tax=Tectimicrobiota bacterium TaxID=2528274 RepID=A0A933GQ19_UNCTE|nr:hypothetical protein [Candidatus Tectomicrobia bacterium]
MKSPSTPSGALENKNPTEKEKQNADGKKNPEKEHVFSRIIGSLAFLVLIIGGFLFYMFTLQRRFFAGCKEEKQLMIFFQSPFGLPEGTIRGVIALIIITFSLSLIVLHFFGITEQKFPEVMAGILGTVIGFYFGTRSASGGGMEEIAREQITDLKAQRNDIQKGKDSAESETVLGKIKKGIAMSKIVTVLLPEEQKKKYDDFIGKLEQGVTTVETLTKGEDIQNALEKGKDLLDLFKKENPVKDIFTKALGSFTSVLGGSAPALLVITTVVSLGVKLVGMAYEKWRTRIFNAPFSPSVTPLEVVDANTGFLLLRMSPEFKSVFTQELAGNDRSFMDTALSLLRQDNVEPFWNRYKDRFESRAQFDEGLKEFQQAAVDLELDPALFAQAGGVRPFMDSVKKINQDPEAQANLHALVTVVEGLQQQGEPVLSIFEKAQKEAGL